MSEVKIYSEATLPTLYGSFKCVVFKTSAGIEHVALVKGDIKNKSHILCRVHSECITSEVFNSLKCDCKLQLDLALEEIANKHEGLLLYLRQEGRGIGLGNKIKAYALQEKGFDTVDANLKLGFEEDAREYHQAAEMLNLLGVKSIELMTNNPVKISALKDAGIEIKIKPHKVKKIHDEALNYLETKRQRMGHLHGE
ncbi:MAG: GTP cyclohydrolase II [bacterium]|nr:GTP cyclohydrolase II [bacterium]